MSGGGGKYLYALNIQTVEELWKFKTGVEIQASPVIVDGVVYFLSGDGYFYAVRISSTMLHDRTGYQ